MKRRLLGVIVALLAATSTVFFLLPVYSSPIPCPAVSKECGQFHLPQYYSGYESLGCVLLGIGTGYWDSTFHLGCPPDHLQLFSSSFAFRITINYSGPWRAEYYGYHGTEAQSTFYNRWGNYTGGTLGGSGYTEKIVPLPGSPTDGLTLCVVAEKFDSSSGVLALGISGAHASNDTSVPYGRTTLCVAVLSAS